MRLVSLKAADLFNFVATPTPQPKTSTRRTHACGRSDNQFEPTSSDGPLLGSDQRGERSVQELIGGPAGFTLEHIEATSHRYLSMASGIRGRLMADTIPGAHGGSENIVRQHHAEKDRRSVDGSGNRRINAWGSSPGRQRLNLKVEAAHHKSSVSSPDHQGLITMVATVGDQNGGGDQLVFETPASGVTASLGLAAEKAGARGRKHGSHCEVNWKTCAHCEPIRS
jgi:hypothetical protein